MPSRPKATPPPSSAPPPIGRPAPTSPSSKRPPPWKRSPISPAACRGRNSSTSCSAGSRRNEGPQEVAAGVVALDSCGAHRAAHVVDDVDGPDEVQRDAGDLSQHREEPDRAACARRVSPYGVGVRI